MGKHVVIEGVMGVGKTTLLCVIRKKINIACVMQDYRHNICLTDYYVRKDCAFQKQMIFLFSNYHLLVDAENRFPTFISDFCLERSMILSDAVLSGSDLALYKENYSNLKQKLSYEKMLIFLHGDVDTIVRHIEKRGRQNEKNISPDYIARCQQALIDNIDFIRAKQTIDINIDTVDTASQECADFLAERISDFMRSTC